MREMRPVVLGDDDIHLWHVDLALFLHRADELHGGLAEDERLRADRYLFPERRAVYIIVRCLLRRVLAAYLARAPDTLRLVLGPYGKPRLADDAALVFNVSHSGDKAVIAVSRGREVGVDLEHARAGLSFLGIAASMFSPPENQALREVQESRERAARFFAYWTRREAFVKALGTGLAACDIRHLDFAAERRFATAPFERTDMRRSTLPPRHAHIVVHDFASFPGYASAVAYEAGASCCNIVSHTLVVPEQTFT